MKIGVIWFYGFLAVLLFASFLILDNMGDRKVPVNGFTYNQQFYETSKADIHTFDGKGNTQNAVLVVSFTGSEFDVIKNDFVAKGSAIYFDLKSLASHIEGLYTFNELAGTAGHIARAGIFLGDVSKEKSDRHLKIRDGSLEVAKTGGDGYHLRYQVLLDSGEEIEGSYRGRL